MTQTYTSIIALIISILGLTISGLTLFFTQFRPPEISTIVGPVIKFYYPRDGGFGIYLPVTFVNPSPKTGIVLRSGITIFQKTTPQQKYYMEWRFFAKLREQGDSYLFEEDAHSIAIPQYSFISKMIWVTWRQFMPQQFRIIEGEYVLFFHYWTSTQKPMNSMHEFLITGDIFKEIESYRIGKQSTIVNVDLDATVRQNLLLNTYEAQSLLGI